MTATVFGLKGFPPLVKAASRVMNPGLSEKVIERAYARDPSAALSEYGAEFRTDIESFVSREAIERGVDRPRSLGTAPPQRDKLCGVRRPKRGRAGLYDARDCSFRGRYGRPRRGAGGEATVFTRFCCEGFRRAS